MIARCLKQLNLQPRKVSKENKHLARGIRNRNPLNIEFNQRNQWLGQLGHDGRFVIFESSIYGFRAATRILRSYQGRNINTIHHIVHTFAPSHENHSEYYVDRVSQWSGFSQHQRLDMNCNDTAARLIQAMARMEVGHQYTLSEVMAGVRLA